MKNEVETQQFQVDINADNYSVIDILAFDSQAQLYSLTHEEAMATHIVFKTADMGGSPQTDAVSPITLKLIKHTRT